MADAEVAEVGNELAGGGKVEVAAELQPVGRAELGHVSRRSTSSDRSANRTSSRVRYARSPRSPGEVISSPFRNTPTTCPSGCSQSRRVMRRPSVRNHHASGSPEPICSPPVRNARRRNTGCARRRQIRRRVYSSRRLARSSWSQPNHEISLSWHHALLLPPCERENSSPPRSIGTPCDSSSVARKLRCCRSRSAFTAASSVGPSTPWFQLRLSSLPSAPPSRLASL